MDNQGYNSAILEWHGTIPFWPGECRVFSAGMKIDIDKNLENSVWQCF
jgi:hypothetical protein